MQSAVARSNSDAAVSGISSKQQGTSACWQYSKGTSYIIAPVYSCRSIARSTNMGFSTVRQLPRQVVVAGSCPPHMTACAFSPTTLCCLVLTIQHLSACLCPCWGKTPWTMRLTMRLSSCQTNVWMVCVLLGPVLRSLDVHVGHFCPTWTSSEPRRVSSSAQTVQNVLAALLTAAYACSSS
jgi:hypothetical protein